VADRLLDYVDDAQAALDLEQDQTAIDILNQRVLSAGLRRCKENDGCTGARHG
jgi:hypothetical protein